MAVCLDTTFLVDLLAGESAAIDFASTLAEPAAVSAVSFYELLFAARGRRRLERVEALSRDYAVLLADYEVCAMAAAIQSKLGGSGEMIPVLDAVIAATAILAGLPVITTDEHFQRIPPDFGLIVQRY